MAIIMALAVQGTLSAHAVDHPNAISNIKVSVNGGNPDDAANTTSAIRVDADWEVVNPQPGDTFSMTLPKELTKNALLTNFNLTDPNDSNKILANCEVTKDSPTKVNCTLTDAVAGESKAFGKMYVVVKVSESTEKTKLEFEVGGKKVYVDTPGGKPIGEGSTNPPKPPDYKLQKSSWQSGTEGLLGWQIRIPGAKTEGVNPVTLVDRFNDSSDEGFSDHTRPDEAKYPGQQQGTFNKYNPDTNKWELVKKYDINWDDDGKGFKVDLTDLDPNSLYSFSYYTQMVDPKDGDIYGNTATVAGEKLVRTQKFEMFGGGTALSENESKFTISKKLEGIAAADLPAGTEFTVKYKINSATPVEGTLKVPADGTAVSSDVFKDMAGAEVTLSEIDLPDVAGYEWGAPAFSESTFELEKGKVTAITLTNTATRQMGSFSVTKAVKGEVAELVPADTEFTVHYTHDGGEGDLKVSAAGGAVESPKLPAGTKVTLSEPTFPEIDGVVWGAPKIEPETVTIAAGEPVNVIVTNTATRKPVLDLALRKTLADGQAEVVRVGDKVTFDIEVFNQGNTRVAGIELVDYLPAELELADANWTAGPDGMATTWLKGGPLAPGKSRTVQLTAKVLQTAEKIENLAEISKETAVDEGGQPIEDADGNRLTDVDSTPDTDKANDKLVDDQIDDDGTVDEDDHDVASLKADEALVLDLALRKTLAQGQDSIVRVGDKVTFDIEVFNQGNTHASGIEVVDYLADGQELADANWTAAAGNTATMKLDGVTLAPGESHKVQVTVKITSVGSLENLAEITKETAVDENGKPVVGPDSKPLTDIDSTPDTDKGNDKLVDDQIDDDGTVDEDDHDVAKLESYEALALDLALRKTLAEGQAEVVRVGDKVTFDIEVFNQGNTFATDIEVVDYLPAELELADANWTAAAGNTATMKLEGVTLAPGESKKVQLTAKVLQTAEKIENLAEISKETAVDENGDPANDADGKPLTDIDSTPDTDKANDKLVDDQIDDNGTVDEDDHDVASLKADDALVLDLALRKTLDPASPKVVKIGDKVTFQVEVFNQGNTHASGIEVVDYLPTGLELADANWTATAGHTATIVLKDVTLAPGESTKVPITVKVLAAGTLDNFAEISKETAVDEKGEPVVGPDGKPLTDVDSTPDTDKGNDVLEDDVINKTPADGDEDDHDIAKLVVSITVTPRPALPETGAAGTDGLGGAGLAAISLLLVSAAAARRRFHV